MNVDDVKLTDKDTEFPDRLEHIFFEQKTLMEKYDHIEESNGSVVVRPPINLDSRVAQIRLKDMAWRVTEELAEAVEAYELHVELESHIKEELMDALHFMVELCILSGFRPEDLGPGEDESIPKQKDLLEGIYSVLYPELYKVGDNFSTAGSAIPINSSRFFNLCFSVTQNLGVAMNCLKNKPWKQTNHPTDINKYRMNIFLAFRDLIFACSEYGMSPQEVYEMYLKKKTVNQFRQRSQY